MPRQASPPVGTAPVVACNLKEPVFSVVTGSGDFTNTPLRGLQIVVTFLDIL